MEHSYLADLIRGQMIDDFYLLKSVSTRTTSAGKPYLSGVLSDESGSIDMVVWDYQGTLNDSSAGIVVNIRGEVAEYRGKAQMSVSRIRPATEKDSYDLSALLPTAPIDPDSALLFVQELINSIDDTDYRTVAQTMLKRHEKSFSTMPAAKSVHHAFRSGLLMHTVNMLRAGDFFAELYGEVIDRSLLLTGILLHDMAKEREFLLAPTGLATEYSLEGDLLGHLVMGAYEVADVCKELATPEEKSILLQHLLLSHHGERELGAAVLPQCAEAELLHLLDSIDSRMEIYAETLYPMTPGTFSPKIFALEKKIYKHN